MKPKTQFWKLIGLMLIAVALSVSPALGQPECTVLNPLSASWTTRFGPDPDNLGQPATHASGDTGIHVVRAAYAGSDMFISGNLVFPAFAGGVVESATLTFRARGGPWCTIASDPCTDETRAAAPVQVVVNGAVAATIPFPATRTTTVALDDVSMLAAGSNSDVTVSVEVKAYPERAHLQWIFGGPEGSFAPPAELEVCTSPAEPDPAAEVLLRAQSIAAGFPNLDVETIMLIFSLMGGPGT